MRWPMAAAVLSSVSQPGAGDPFFEGKKKRRKIKEKKRRERVQTLTRHPAPRPCIFTVSLMSVLFALLSSSHARHSRGAQSHHQRLSAARLPNYFSLGTSACPAPNLRTPFAVKPSIVRIPALVSHRATTPRLSSDSQPCLASNPTRRPSVSPSRDIPLRNRLRGEMASARALEVG